MAIKNSKIEKIIYLQIAIGLFANLLALYSIYQIKSFDYSFQDFGLICFASPYQYRWLVDISGMLAIINSVLLFIGSWWQTNIGIKKSVLLFIPVEIYLLDLAICTF